MGPGHGKAMANTSFGACGVSPAGGIHFQRSNFFRGRRVSPAGGIHFQKSNFFEAVGSPLPGESIFLPCRGPLI